MERLYWIIQVGALLSQVSTEEVKVREKGDVLTETEICVLKREEGAMSQGIGWALEAEKSKKVGSPSEIPKETELCSVLVPEDLFWASDL